MFFVALAAVVNVQLICGSEIDHTTCTWVLYSNNFSGVNITSHVEGSAILAYFQDMVRNLKCSLIP